MGRPRILIAGIGNIFLGDDGFGVEVVRRLAERDLPSAARVADFGIRGLDLAYALCDGYETVILVDAAPRGKPPGTVSLIEPEKATFDGPSSAGPMLDMHGLDPVKVLRLAASMDAPIQRVLLVGCEPLPRPDDNDMSMELSAPVHAAVDEALRLIESLLEELLPDERPTTTEVPP